MLLVLLPLGAALVVISVLGLAGFGPLTAERRAQRDGGLRAIGPAVGLLAGIGVIALTIVATVGLAGVDGLDDRESDERADQSEVKPTTTTTVSITTGASRFTRQIPALGPEITIEADRGRSFPHSYDVADRLEPATVLQITARGFDSFGRAIVEQCGRVGAANACFNPLPVQLDADGVARFQYLITAEFVFGRSPRGACRAAASPCTVVVRAVTGPARGEVQTIFGDEIPPPGQIRVTPATELSLEGGPVTVDVRDYPPGAPCDRDALRGAACLRPGLRRAGPDGSARRRSRWSGEHRARHQPGSGRQPRPAVRAG